MKKPVSLLAKNNTLDTFNPPLGFFFIIRKLQEPHCTLYTTFHLLHIMPPNATARVNSTNLDDMLSASQYTWIRRRVSNDKHENDKLVTAFQSRYIRLRLHGTRLPKGYTVIMRLPSNEIMKRPTARRKKSEHKPTRPLELGSDAEDQALPQNAEQEENIDTDTDEDAQTRASNAYPGSNNDIGSIHQRH